MALYAEGISLAAIAREPEMPAYSTLLKWAKDLEAFRNELAGANAMRALVFEERAREVAEVCVHKDDVPAARLKFDAYRWSAEVNDSSRYGKKTTIEGNKDKPLTFIIQTGFPEPTPGQMPPRLGADGLIEKAIEVAVESEIQADNAQEEFNVTDDFHA